MNLALIKKPIARQKLSKNFIELAVQDFETVCNHKDCSLADVWSAHLGRTNNQEAEECKQQLLKQANFSQCKKSTYKRRCTQSPIIVPLSIRNASYSDESTLTATSSRAEVTIFIWQQLSDGKFHKKYLSDEEAQTLFERLAAERAKRTAKSQIQ